MTSIPIAISHALPNRHKLPAKIIQWSITPSQVVLFIYAMQAFFLSPFDQKTQADLIKQRILMRQSIAENNAHITDSADVEGMAKKQRNLDTLPLGILEIVNKNQLLAHG